ncbi:Puromycin N-acetyltransferase [Vanrija pseudolonga]|uniref:Puromycin N-acetyltransferase n=1 Tax=Vanrija pseudolonga TaxID=143232 RepID=A0AAF1BFR5_9TREE|nr:Puromycin N-acetyltransferase [Vanrija pseudolonga]
MTDDSEAAVTVRRVVSPSHAERAQIKRVLADAYGGSFGHMKILDHNPAANAQLVSSMVDHALRRHEVVVAEVGGRVAGAALDDDEDVFYPSLQHLPARMAEFLSEHVFLTQRYIVDATLPHAETEWWYLAWLGVTPRFQRRGVASALLRAKMAEAGGVPIGLRTDVDDNIPLYEHFGFAVRLEHTFRLPWGATWHERFLSYPADASTAVMRELAAEADACGCSKRA